MRKSICIIALSTIARDARVLRQVKYLSPFHDLTVIGYGPPPSAYASAENITWIPLDQNSPHTTVPLAKALKNLDLKNMSFWKRVFTKVNQAINRVLLLTATFFPPAYDAWYMRQGTYVKALRSAINTRCDAYHANDWDTLPIAAEAAKRNDAALVVDLHEYAPLEYEERPRWWIQKRLITYILRKYSPEIDTAITVAAPIAEKYRQEFGFYPTVIMNAPESLSPLPQRIGDTAIKLLHHGGASRSRHPELMMETVALCDARYSLHFMFLHNDYVEELKMLAEKIAPGRVFFHDPVPPEEITKRIAQFDVGFYILRPTNYNNLVALPNKFLDFICAGLAVAIGPSPSMAEIVNRYGLGVVCHSFDPGDMATLLNKTTPEQWSGMKRAAREASKVLNAQVEMKKLVDIYSRLL